MLPFRQGQRSAQQWPGTVRDLCESQRHVNQRPVSGQPQPHRHPRKCHLAIQYRLEPGASEYRRGAEFRAKRRRPKNVIP